MFLLKQEDIQKMAYKTHDDAVTYSYGDEEKLRKRFNRKIIMNYILSALLGAVITTQVFLATKNPEIIKKLLLADVLAIFAVSVASVSSSIIKLIKAEKEQKDVYY